MTSPRHVLPWGLIRTPAFSYRAMDNAGSQCDPLALLQDPWFERAVRVVSESLHESAVRARAGGACSEGLRRSLRRYFLRSATRCTPNRLFAGVAMVEIGDHARVELAPRESWQARAHISRPNATRALRQFASSPEGDALCTYRLSDTAMQRGLALQYFDNLCLPTRLRTVADGRPLAGLLARRAEQWTKQQLPAMLQIPEDLDPEDIEQYIEQLIESRILVSMAEPSGLGGTPEEEVRRWLESVGLGEHPFGRMAESLCGLTRKPREVLDEAFNVWWDRLRSHAWVRADGAAAESQSDADVSAGGDGSDASRRTEVQLVLWARAGKGGVPLAVADRTVCALQKLDFLWQSVAATGTRQAIVDFFVRGSVQRRVPLLQLAHYLTETHQAFARFQTLPFNHELDGLGLGAGVTAEVGPVSLQAAVLEQLRDGEASALEQIDLDVARLQRAAAEQYMDRQPKPWLPQTAEVMVRAIELNGAATTRLWFAQPPGGAVNRFLIWGDPPELIEQLRASWAREAADAAPAILADVTWAPVGDVGDVSADLAGLVGDLALRPRAFAYQIVVDGNASVDPAHRIGLHELEVYAADEGPGLWWRKAGVRVLPTLRSMANQSLENSPVLAILQACRLDAHWSFPAISDSAGLARAPRVCLDGIVLRPRSWWVPSDLRGRLTHGPIAAGDAQVLSWRTRLQVPALVRLGSEPHAALLDLEADWAWEELSRKARGAPAGTIELQEEFPEGPHSIVMHDDSPHACEMIFYAASAETAPQGKVSCEAPPPPCNTVDQVFAPGSTWLTAKIYLPPSLEESVLAGPLHDLVEGCTSQLPLTQWHFLRYGDPERHVRLRLCTSEPDRLLSFVHAALETQRRQGAVRRWVLDSYEREVDRYGGPEAIEWAEGLFTADSRCSLYALRAIELEELDDIRLLWSLRTVHTMLRAFGLELPDRLALLSAIRDERLGRFRQTAALKQTLASRFRQLRGEASAVFSMVDGIVLSGVEAEEDDPEIAEQFASLQRQAEISATAYRRLEAAGTLTGSVKDVLRSMVHMHCNRLLGSVERETAFCYINQRVTESAVAQMRRLR